MTAALKAIWAEKIDSKALFDAALDRSASAEASWRERHIQASNSSCLLGSIPVPTDASCFVETGSVVMTDAAWYVNREIAREAYGVYPPCTSTLRYLRQSGMCGMYFPHVSKDDPAMIAFTPDRTAGMADKQIRTSIGKFLRKFLPLFSDKYIAKLEEAHRAELDPTFLTATTVGDIEDVYTSMRGDSGCMRYERDYFDLKDYHPSAVYASPETGISVAYLRDGSGEVYARSVIYVNPDDAADKRYVRIYGAPVLRTKLERAGFRLAGLEGARVPLLEDDWDEDELSEGYIKAVSPYFDAPGGAGSSTREKISSQAILFKGDKFFTMISEQKAQTYSSAGFETTPMRPQRGSVQFKPIDRDQLEVTSAISGEKFNRLEAVSVRWMHEDGTLGWIKDADRFNPDSAFHRIYGVGVGPDKEFKGYMYMSPEAHAKHAIPGRSYFNNECTREYAGIVKLDPTFYPDRPYTDGAVACTSHDEDSDFSIYSDEALNILLCDAVRVWPQEGSEYYAHYSAVAHLKGYTSFTVAGRRYLVASKHPQLVRTVSNRKALVGVHDIKQNCDGRWDYSRNLSVVYVCRVGFIVSGNATKFNVSDEAIQAGVERAMNNYSREDGTGHGVAAMDAVISAINSDAESRCNNGHAHLPGSLALVNDTLVMSYGSLTRAASVAAAQRVVSMTDDDLQAHLGSDWSARKVTARVVLAVEARRAELVAKLEAAITWSTRVFNGTPSPSQGITAAATYTTTTA